MNGKTSMKYVNTNGKKLITKEMLEEDSLPFSTSLASNQWFPPQTKDGQLSVRSADCGSNVRTSIRMDRNTASN